MNALEVTQRSLVERFSHSADRRTILPIGKGDGDASRRVWENLIVGESDRAVRYVAWQVYRSLAGKAIVEGMTIKIAETISFGFAGHTK